MPDNSNKPTSGGKEEQDHLINFKSKKNRLHRFEHMGHELIHVKQQMDGRIRLDLDTDTSPYSARNNVDFKNRPSNKEK